MYIRKWGIVGKRGLRWRILSESEYQEKKTFYLSISEVSINASLHIVSTISNIIHIIQVVLYPYKSSLYGRDLYINILLI